MQRKLVGPLRGLFWQTAVGFGGEVSKEFPQASNF